MNTTRAKRQIRKVVREMLEGKLKAPEPKPSEEPAKDKGAGPNGA